MLLGLFVVATLIAVMVVQRAGQVFAILGAAVTVAVIAAPLVRGLARWMPRGAAIVIVTLVGMFGIVAVLGVVAWDLDRQASELSDSLHRAVADLPEGSTAAETAADLELDDRIDRVFDGAAARLVLGETNPLAVAGQIGKVVIVGVLAAFIVAGGRRVVDMGLRFIRRTSIREELHNALSTAVARAGGYLRRTIAVSALHGIVAGLVSWVLGLPGPITVAAWVAVASTVPILGGALAWLPVVALATVNDVSLPVAVVIALVCIVADRFGTRPLGAWCTASRSIALPVRDWHWSQPGRCIRRAPGTSRGRGGQRAVERPRTTRRSDHRSHRGSRRPRYRGGSRRRPRRGVGDG